MGPVDLERTWGAATSFRFDQIAGASSVLFSGPGVSTTPELTSSPSHNQLPTISLLDARYDRLAARSSRETAGH